MISIEGLFLAGFSLLFFLLLTLIGEAQAAVNPKHSSTHDEETENLPEETAGEFLPSMLLLGAVTAVTIWLLPLAAMWKDCQKTAVVLSVAMAAVVFLTIKRGILDD